MSSPELPGPRVLREENDGSFRISSIRSDTDPSISLAKVVTDGGDVGISISDPKSGLTGIDLVPLAGGGANPKITEKFRNFARELAEFVESGGE